MTSSSVVRVAVTGAAGQIGYAIVPLIARGDLLGPHTRVELRLLDIEPAMKVLQAVEAELHDCAFPLLHDVVISADPRVAFDGVHVAILCGAFPRKDGMERKDLLQLNAKIFEAQGAALGEVAAQDCRVCVVGNPANTNAWILLQASKGRLNPRHVTAMTRLDHNRSLAHIAQRAKVPVSEVKNVVIWGNHSSTQVPDVNSACVAGKAVREAGLETEEDGAKYWDGPFMKAIQGRGAEVIKLRGLSSALSAAKAAVDHVHDWMCGTHDGNYVSMAVLSDGNSYKVPNGLIYSFPCTCAKGEWSIVPGLTISPVVQKLLDATTAELQDEKAQAGY